MREPEITMVIKIFQLTDDQNLLKYALITLANLC